MDDLIDSRRARLSALCARTRVQRLDIFGSAARRDFDPAASDPERRRRRLAIA